MNSSFTVEDLRKKVGENPFCYLTGRSIDLTKPSTYAFDHINPATLGGDNSIENLGVVCKRANQAKADMPLEEFINLCKEVLIKQGYRVEKWKGGE